VARSCGNNFLLFGWLGMLVGGIQILRLADDMSTVAPACSVMLLTLLYGYCVKALVFNPLTDKYLRISSRLPELSVER
jgi:flagellar motor component MotA